MVMHPHTKYHWPISKEKNVMTRTRKYYLKKKKRLFDLEVKVPRRSLKYATHRLMVMHPHTKYNWPILGKTKKLWSGQASLGRSRRRKNQTKTMSPFVRRGDIIIITIFDWNQKFNWLWYFFIVLYESIVSFSRITSCLLQLIAFSWIVFHVCKVCTLEEELITCIIFLLWSWRNRRVWQFQRGNQSPSIEKEQTTQWPKEKGQMDKQRSTKQYT